MWSTDKSRMRFCSFLVIGLLLFAGEVGAAELMLGPEQMVQAGGVEIVVPGYSVPSFVDWNNDGWKDLIVGEGSGSITPRVRLYLNEATEGEPVFSSFSYVQAHGVDLTVPGGGCLGLFPRVVDWNGDNRKDMLVGRADGMVDVFLNSGTDAVPVFTDPTRVQCKTAAPGVYADVDVGVRATPTFVDWDSDGRMDLVVGAYDSHVHVYRNSAGAPGTPDLEAGTLAQDNGGELSVPTGRSSPVVADLDGDGKKDLLVGNTEGELLLYINTGTALAPSFSGYIAMEADENPIDLPDATRSRPFVCDWNEDGYADVLVGARDGYVRLYQGVPEPATLSLLVLLALSLPKRLTLSLPRGALS